MIKHILFPYDDSEHSKQALFHVKHLARMYQAKVTVLNVYHMSKIESLFEIYFPSGHTGLEHQATSHLVDVKKLLMDKSLEILKRAKEELLNAHIQVECLSIDGHPKQVITEKSQQLECDLIIMGKRGAGTIKSYLLGSVSDYVLQHAQQSILLTHHKKTKYKRILFPIRNAKVMNEPIMEFLISLAKSHQSIVTLFHAWNTKHKYAWDYLEDHNPEYHSIFELQKMMKKEARHNLFKINQYLDNHGIEVADVLYEGHVGEGITNTAIAHHCDLILMEHCSHKRMSRSIRYISHHSPCPVLLY